MSRVNKKHHKSWLKWIVPLGAIDFALFIAYLLMGKNIALFHPKGLIARQQHSILLFTVAVLLSIAIPTLVFLFHTAWKYRESNAHVTYDARSRGKGFVFGVWALPTVFLLILAPTMWISTHKLEPQKAIASNAKPLTIQVVSLRWKWLFIYPEQNIATVNFLQIPVDTPVEFELTADDAPMSSFWIPNLSGQLYTMTGMVNRLNIMAETPGDYPGSSAELNGAGFSGMRFTARASSQADFSQWVQQAKQSPDTLDAATYANVLEPSENNPPAYYSSFDSSLYDTVVMKYMGHAAGHEGHHE